MEILLRKWIWSRLKRKVLEKGKPILSDRLQLKTKTTLTIFLCCFGVITFLTFSYYAIHLNISNMFANFYFCHKKNKKN